MTVIKPGDQLPYTVSPHTQSDSIIHCGLVLWQQKLKLEISFKGEIKICPLVLTMA